MFSVYSQVPEYNILQDDGVSLTTLWRAQHYGPALKSPGFMRDPSSPPLALQSLP